jgi:hypothetical protein
MQKEKKTGRKRKTRPLRNFADNLEKLEKDRRRLEQAYNALAKVFYELRNGGCEFQGEL